MYIYGIDCHFSLDLSLRLLGLLLIILCTVILIVVDTLSVVRHFVGGCQFCCNLAVEGGEFGVGYDNLRQCRFSVAALPVGFSFSWL